MSTITVTVEHAEVIRLRTFDRGGEDALSLLDTILSALKSERATGRLMLNLNQGHVASFQFEERQRLRP